jgi:small-conductance mechanosensitive channel
MQNSVENVLATVTEKVLEKPVIQFPNISLSFSDVIWMGMILAIFYGIFFTIKLILALQVKRNKIKKAQSKTLSQLAGYVVAITAIASAFSSVGYSLTYLLVGSTALLVGLGFGLQQLFVDLVSGVILLIDPNINYGDVISVDIPGTSVKMQGRVIQIGLRTTTLETIDNERLIVPNSKVLSNGVRSLMRSSGSVRFRVQVLVAYDSNMENAKNLMTKSVLSHEKVDQEPKPTIIIKNFEENGVLLEIRFWMKEIFNSENILSDIRFKILENFRNEGIEIPYPQRVMIEKK